MNTFISFFCFSFIISNQYYLTHITIHHITSSAPPLLNHPIPHVFCVCCIYLKYLDTLSPFSTLFTLNIGTPYLLNHTCPKIWNTCSPFYYLLMCLKYCCMYDKQCWPWSDATFCGIWSGSTLFLKVYPRVSVWILRLLWYSCSAVYDLGLQLADAFVWILRVIHYQLNDPFFFFYILQLSPFEILSSILEYRLLYGEKQ